MLACFVSFASPNPRRVDFAAQRAAAPQPFSAPVRKLHAVRLMGSERLAADAINVSNPRWKLHRTTLDNHLDTSHTLYDGFSLSPGRGIVSRPLFL